MKHMMIAMFTALGSVISAAQTPPTLSTSDQFPLMAHVKQVEMEQGQRLVGNVSQGNGSIHGGSCTWHLMIAEINGHTYGLGVSREPLQHRNWLHIGDYPCRQTKKGFEFEYHDENGKLRLRNV